MSSGNLTVKIEAKMILIILTKAEVKLKLNILLHQLLGSTITSWESMSASNVSSWSIVGGSKAKVGLLERR